MGNVRYFLSQILYLYEWVIVIECILSWLRMTGSTVVEDVYQATNTLVEPVVGLFRRFIPPIMGMDFSPMVALLVIEVVRNLVY